MKYFSVAILGLLAIVYLIMREKPEESDPLGKPDAGTKPLQVQRALSLQGPSPAAVTVNQRQKKTASQTPRLTYAPADLARLQKDGKCVKCNLEGVDLSGRDLSGVNLEGANLKGADFSGSTLRDVIFRGALLEGANLTYTDMRQADLSKSNLTKASLSESDLTFTNVVGATILNANLSGTKLLDAHLDGADFSGSDLSGANLKGATLVKTKFTDAILSSAAFMLSKNFPLDALSSSQKCEAEIFGSDGEPSSKNWCE